MPSGRKSILVVEHVESERRELADALAALGYEVEAAGTDSDALRAFENLRHDVVIVEVLLPGVGGLALGGLIKERAPDQVRVIVTSKLQASRNVRDAAIRRHGADAFFQKPFEIADLAATVIDFIGPGERPPAPEEAPAPEPLERGALSPPVFADLLVRLAQGAFSGALRVASPEGAKELVFDEGTCVAVRSNIRDEALGRILVAEGTLDEATYRDIVEECARTGRKAGAVLVGRGVMTAQELTASLTRQTLVKAANVFSWREGEWRLAPASERPARNANFEARVEDILRLGLDRFAPADAADALSARLSSLTGGAAPLGAGAPAESVGLLIREIDDLAPRLDDLSYFELLGLPESATRADVERAFAERDARFEAATRTAILPAPVRRRARAIRERLREAIDMLRDDGARRVYLKLLVRRGSPVPPAPAQGAMTAEAWFQRGLLAFGQQNWALAADAFRRAVDDDADTAEYHARLGEALFRLATAPAPDLADAERNLARAARLSPNNAEYACRLGEVLRHAGKDAAAAREFRRALAIEPSHDGAARQLRAMKDAAAAGEGGR
ncbi:response regulator [bacterium]|nr:response regulator [bacterium]